MVAGHFISENKVFNEVAYWPLAGILCLSGQMLFFMRIVDISNFYYRSAEWIRNVLVNYHVFHIFLGVYIF